MAKKKLFRKEVVSEGVYRLADGRLEPITADRIRHWAAEITRYLKNGNLLPGPWTHVDDRGNPIVMGPNGTLERSDLNAGFWEKAEAEVTENGVTLVAYLDADEETQDKIGKSVRETSIYVQPKFVDGRNNVYNDVPLHIALVTHAIQPGQKNFEPVEPNLAIAMSQRAFKMSAVPKGDDASATPATTQPKTPEGNQAQSSPPPASTTTPDLSAVIQALRTCGIVLPEDTNEGNFLSYLMVALGQKAAGDSDGMENSLNQPPEGATPKSPAPVAMSQAITPETFANISRDVFMSHPAAKELVAANEALRTHLTNQARQLRQDRVNALIADGTITQEYAAAHINPLLAAFQMSFGNDQPTPVDAVLVALEAASAARRTAQANQQHQNHLLSSLAMSAGGQQPPPNGVPVPPPFANEQYDAPAIIKQFFANTGGLPLPPQ